MLGWIVALAMTQDSDRVEVALQRKGAEVHRLLTAVGLPEPCPHIFLRAFKQEGVLEVWGSVGKKYKLIRTHPIAVHSGTVGPKRREGDKQVPGRLQGRRLQP